MAKKQRIKVGRPASSQHAPPRPANNDAAAQGAMQAAQQAVQYLNRGDLQNAVAIIDRGLKLDPTHPDLLHLGGQAALHSGQIDRGIQLIEAAIKRAPKIALYHYNLGAARAAKDDLDGALASFRRTVRLDPTAADAFANLGIVFVKKQQQEEAEAAFSEAARLQPGSPQMHLNLAICNMELRHPAKVISAISRVEELVPQPDAKLLHEIGNIYRGLGRHLVAEDYYRRALALKPESPEIWFALGDVLSQAGEHDTALEALNRAAALDYEVAPVKTALAKVLADRGQIDQAKTLLAEAFEAARDDVLYINRVANEYTLIGDFAAQEACLNRVLQLDPGNVGAFAGLVVAPGRKLSEDEAGRLRQLADSKEVVAETRKNIGFALGNYYRYAKKFDQSFKYYRLGNRLKGYSFDRQKYLQWMSQVESTLTRDFFAARRGWGNPSRMPVLIVGMPRSGTTLTEQIVSSHPQVFGAGEYGGVASLARVSGLDVPDLRVQLGSIDSMTAEQVDRHAAAYLAKMQALAEHGESFVTNKLPHNFQQLGLFGLLFPEAPIIHIKRDPRDNLLSIYFQDFAGFHDYAYDLKTLGIYYRLYERLMEHWASVIPNPIYQLQYEELVADLPDKTQQLADFIGVELDQHMLRFWEQERKVETASKWQVRQPLYTSSVARWKPYARHLRAMFDALGLSAD